MTTEPQTATPLDPWQVLHDNDFSWDDVNAIAAILDHYGFVIEREAPVRHAITHSDPSLCGGECWPTTERTRPEPHGDSYWENDEGVMS